MCMCACACISICVCVFFSLPPHRAQTRASFGTTNLVHLIFVIVFSCSPCATLTLTFLSQSDPLCGCASEWMCQPNIHLTFLALPISVFLPFGGSHLSFYAILPPPLLLPPHILYQLLWFHFEHFQSFEQKFEPKWFAILIIAFIYRYDLVFASEWASEYEFHFKIVSHQKIHFEPLSCTSMLLYIYVLGFFFVHITQRKINELVKERVWGSKAQQWEKKTNSDHEQVQRRKEATAAAAATTNKWKERSEWVSKRARIKSKPFATFPVNFEMRYSIYPYILNNVLTNSFTIVSLSEYCESKKFFSSSTFSSK